MVSFTKISTASILALGMSSTTEAWSSYKCVGPIHAENTRGKTLAAGTGGALAGAAAGAAAGTYAGALVSGGVLALPGAIVGGVIGAVKGGGYAVKGVRFRGSAFQCSQFGGVCCTGNFRGTQDFIVGADMQLDIPCRHCWGAIRRRHFKE